MKVTAQHASGVFTLVSSEEDLALDVARLLRSSSRFTDVVVTRSADVPVDLDGEASP